MVDLHLHPRLLPHIHHLISPYSHLAPLPHTCMTPPSASRRTDRMNVRFVAFPLDSGPTEISMCARSIWVNVRLNVPIAHKRLVRRETCKSFWLFFPSSSCLLGDGGGRYELTIPLFFILFLFFFFCRNKHIRALHEKSRPFKCPECTSQFAFQDGLSRHISMVHREARPFQCPDTECDKAFKQKAHAEKHYSSVHQKLKPCVCFCGAAFRENYNMKQHQRAVHNMNPQ